MPGLARAVPEPFVEMHPLLAERVGIAEGARVLLTSRRGQVVAVAHVTAGIRPDTVFMPFHWGGIGGVNRVTSDATDPISGMPEFKVCAVEVRPHTGRPGSHAELPVATLVTTAREAP